jgi:hypothetical protein
LTSKAFYSDQAIGSQIKSPVQLTLGTIRLLDLEMPQYRALVGGLTQMGQVPFAPPNVRGWPGGRMWINTSTLFVRYNTGVYLAGGGSALFPKMGGKKFDTVAKNNKDQQSPAVNFQPNTADQGMVSGDDVVDQWVNRLIQRPIDADKRKVLVDALNGQPQRPDNVRKMVQLIVSMPEYQLC